MDTFSRYKKEHGQAEIRRRICGSISEDIPIICNQHGMGEKPSLGRTMSGYLGRPLLAYMKESVMRKQD
jgi:hypothetical protein